MVRISIIAAIDEKRGLGANNQLLVHLPADLAYFKKMTLGKPVIMGRKTYQSIGKPLPSRLNLVLSQQKTTIPGVVLVRSIEQALEQCINSDEVMIIGGAQIYSSSIDLAHRLYITKIHHQFNADVLFPEIDPDDWYCSNTEFRARDDKNAYDMTFYIYERKLRVAQNSTKIVS